MIKNLCMIFSMLSLNAPLFGQHPNPDRTFTRMSDNKTVVARIVSYDGKKVILKVKGSKEFTFDPGIFIDTDQKHLDDWLLTSRGLPARSDLDTRIKPGASFRVEMPGLAPTFLKQPAGFTISIPPDYSYPNPVPLLVFLNGGSGNESLDAAKSITEGKSYVLVSLPFSSEIKKDGPLGQSKKNMELIEAYHEAMLKELQTLVPNLSETHRILAGSSNGAHIIGAAIALDWDCYLDFFRGFVLWEGGGSISRDFKAAKGKGYCSWVGWGGKSEFKDFTIGVAKAMDDSRMNITKEEIGSAGHGMNKDAQLAVGKWLSEVAEPAFVRISENN
ncbi:MAG TPA: hypothetical protein VLO11_14215 [Luteolibacter sp.]|nr:hypothetical protein [Luteolibacter sp.]